MRYYNVLEQDKKLGEFYSKNQSIFSSNYEFDTFRSYVVDEAIRAGYVREERLIEEAVPSLIENLSEKGIVIMDLTARLSSTAKSTHETLKKIEINFEKLLGIEGKAWQIPNLNVYMDNGIFFTGNRIKKAHLIPSCIRLISKRLNKKGPYTVYHFDDNNDELKNYYELEKLVSTLIPKSILSEEVAIHPYLYTKGKDLQSEENLYKEIQEIFYKEKSIKKNF